LICRPASGDAASNGGIFIVVVPHGMLKFTAIPAFIPIGFQGMTINVNDLSQNHSVFNQYMAEIRDVTVQNACPLKRPYGLVLWIRN
jgi:hypothetical protein